MRLPSPPLAVLLGLLCSLWQLTTPALALQQQALQLADLGWTAQPSLAVDPIHKRFLLSWQARLGDGCTALRVAPLDAEGRLGAVREVARGCDWFVNWVDFPSLVVADNGDWLGFWLRRNGPDTYHYEILSSRSQDQGLSWSAALAPHRDGSASEHGFVSMAAAGGDRVRMIWLDGRNTVADAAAQGHGTQHAHHHEGPMTLRSAVLRRGQRIVEEAEIDPLVCSCCPTALLREGPGRFLAAWRDRSEDELRDIALARWKDGRWQALGLVHADGWRIGACPSNGPVLARHPQGQILAVWPTMPDGQQMLVRARLLDGPAAVVEIDRGAAVLGRVGAAAFGAGWLLSWLGSAEDSEAALLLSRRDIRLDELERVTVQQLPASRNIGVPRLASLGEQAALVWTEVDSSAQAVDGRRPTRIAGVLLRD